MEAVQAAGLVARELLTKKAKLVILCGSAARGKRNPGDLDIAAIFEEENPLLYGSYKRSLVQKLGKEVGFRIDLFDYNEKCVEELVDKYRKDPRGLCWSLNSICMDRVRDQWVGWPLTWIFGDEARERLEPYACFQREFLVLKGWDYLEELRKRIREPYE